MIPVTRTISINESELSESFIRASGPGGQNVNKVASAVQLRFDVERSQSLSPEVKQRLSKIAGTRLTSEGEIVIKAQRFRTLERNRQDAVDRLVGLIRRASVEPKHRRPTKPTKASKEKRLEAKSRRSVTKAQRGRPIED